MTRFDSMTKKKRSYCWGLGRNQKVKNEPFPSLYGHFLLPTLPVITNARFSPQLPGPICPIHLLPPWRWPQGFSLLYGNWYLKISPHPIGFFNSYALCFLKEQIKKCTFIHIYTYLFVHSTNFVWHLLYVRHITVFCECPQGVYIIWGSPGVR